MNKTWTTLWLAALLACLPGLALAQVATTDLLPGQVRYAAIEAGLINGTSFTPDNPAALMWGASSRIGAGYLQHKGQASTTPGTEKVYGSFLGGRWTGDRMALGAGYVTLKDNTPAYPLEQSLASGQAAFKVADFLSFGVGLASEHLDAPQFSPLGPVPTKADTTDRLLGVSLNLGDWLYLGYGAGRERLELKAPGMSTSAEREVTQSGIAVRAVGTWRLYLAYDEIDRGNYDFGGGNGQKGLKASTGTVQIGVWNLLAGYAQSDLEDRGDPASDITYSHYDMAWAPEHGFSLGYRRAELKLKNSSFTPEQTFTTDSIVVAWLF